MKNEVQGALVNRMNCICDTLILNKSEQLLSKTWKSFWKKSEWQFYYRILWNANLHSLMYTSLKILGTRWDFALTRRVLDLYQNLLMPVAKQSFWVFWAQLHTIDLLSRSLQKLKGTFTLGQVSGKADTTVMMRWILFAIIQKGAFYNASLSSTLNLRQTVQERIRSVKFGDLPTSLPKSRTLTKVVGKFASQTTSLEKCYFTLFQRDLTLVLAVIKFQLDLHLAK